MTFEDEDKRGLHSIGLDRTDERAHLLSAFATEYALSPDEKWVAFREKFNAYIAPFIRTGKTHRHRPGHEVDPGGEGDEGSGRVSALGRRRARGSTGRSDPSSSRAISKTPSPSSPARRRNCPTLPPTAPNISFSQPSDVPTGKLALTGARIITMHGDDVIDDGTVVIDGNRITAVGRARAPPFPPDAKVIDVAGKTIMPGIVDVHWHGSMGADEIIPQQSWVNYAALAFGVTTLHDPSNNSAEIFSASRARSAPAMIVGPRIFSTGTILYGAQGAVQGGHRPISTTRSSHLRRMKAVGAISVKSYNQPREMQRAGDDPRAAHLLHRHDPLRRQGPVQSRHRQSRRRPLPSPPDESDRRDQREELQPAAPRSAPAGHRSRAPDRHDGRARGRVAVRAQHDHGRRRAHRRRALHPGGQRVRRRRRSSGRSRTAATRRR